MARSQRVNPELQAQTEARAILGIDIPESNTREAPELDLQASEETLMARGASNGGDLTVPAGAEMLWDFDFQGPLYSTGEGDHSKSWYNDVSQGGLDNCYVMAAISAIAAQNPGYIQNMINDLGNGQYEVTLWKRNGRGRHIEHKVTVDSGFPSISDNAAAYANMGDNGEIWVAILEKALAKLWGGYHRMDNGGDPATAFLSLTGNTTMTHWTANNSPTKLLDHINTALAAGDNVVAGTANIMNDRTLGQSLGLIYPHAYVVLSTDGQNVTLYNPLGRNSTGSDHITITAEQLKKAFLRVQVN